MDTSLEMSSLMSRFPRPGKIEWMCIRPGRELPVRVCKTVTADDQTGLLEDHFNGKPGDKRMVTFIQKEHIEFVAAILGRDCVDPALLRRNIVVSGLNLVALKQQYFRIGEAVFQGTTHCPPCSRMEKNLGEGGYNAMRGHGGINARVIQGGVVNVGDVVEYIGEAYDV
ncbi:MOSC domain-containing protein [Mariniblastus sp.]|jgi:MOSC domain-containing protein YiiM|nr:MOSC domain-containing protein [Mariniblastus sp.]